MHNTPPGYYPFSVGRLTCVAISDGAVPAGAELFAPEMPPEQVAALYEERGCGPVPSLANLACLVVVDEEAGSTTLIDLGMGEVPGPSGEPLPTGGKLVANLRAAAIDPEAVDTVLVSHLHMDHIGGAFERDDRPVFPNATFHVGEVEAAFWSGEAPELTDLLAPPGFAEGMIAEAKRFLRLAEGSTELYSPGDEVLPGITASGVPGHVVGQAAFLIESGDDSLLYTADAITNPITSIERPEWRFFGDSDSATAVKTRLRLIEELRESHRLFFSPHFPWPNLGRIGAVGDQAVWTPAVYELG